MTIRPVEAGDFESIAAITNYYILHTPIHFASEPVTAQATHDAWNSKREKYPFLVACGLDGRLVAFAKAGQWRERAAYDKTAETGVYVQHGHGGQGIGTPLYRALIDDCAWAGFHTLVAEIALPKEPSIRLHERGGFTPLGVFREVGWKMGSWHDVSWWQRML
jgi:L-amino acid N-acyltransferase YncA